MAFQLDPLEDIQSSWYMVISRSTASRVKMAPMHLGDPEALGARAAALASGTKNVTRSTTQVERVTGTIVYDCRK